jgi:hypothetical protein
MERKLWGYILLTTYEKPFKLYIGNGRTGDESLRRVRLLKSGDEISITLFSLSSIYFFPCIHRDDDPHVNVWLPRKVQ